MSDYQLYCGDCLDVMPTLSGIDAVITDPPYGVNGAILNPNRKPGKSNASHNTWHPEPDWDGEINPEWCRAVCSASDLVAWFGNWRRRFSVESAMRHPIRAEIVWAKNTHVGPPCPLAMRDERIWLFGKRGIKGETFETSVWDEPIKHTRAYRHHKNEKPVKLMERLVLFLTHPGQTILDPFMGSGATGIACVQTGRKFIGVEKEQKYFEIAQRRIAEAQPRLAEFA